jgi:hypothetical protein
VLASSSIETCSIKIHTKCKVTAYLIVLTGYNPHACPYNALPRTWYKFLCLSLPVLIVLLIISRQCRLWNRLYLCVPYVLPEVFKIPFPSDTVENPDRTRWNCTTEFILVKPSEMKAGLSNYWWGNPNCQVVLIRAINITGINANILMHSTKTRAVHTVRSFNLNSMKTCIKMWRFTDVYETCELFQIYFN